MYCDNTIGNVTELSAFNNNHLLKWPLSGDMFSKYRNRENSCSSAKSNAKIKTLTLIHTGVHRFEYELVSSNFSPAQDMMEC